MSALALWRSQEQLCTNRKHHRSDNTLSQRLIKALTSQGYDTFGFSWAELGLPLKNEYLRHPAQAAPC